MRWVSRLKKNQLPLTRHKVQLDTDMGKISKALEKAEKDKSVTPVRQSELQGVTPDSDAAEHSVNVQHASQPDHRKPTVQPNHAGIENNRVSSSTKTVEPIGQQAVFESSEMIAEQSTRHVDGFPSHDTRQNQDPTKISLLKPISAEAEGPHMPPSRQPQGSQISGMNAATGIKAEKKRVDVKYSKTKVQSSDPEKLKNNRVVSLFEDIETTNQFKMIRTKVLRKLKEIGGNSILVTSANPCEGKTFTSINLGISIAKEFDRTVLIVDADVRRPLKEHTDFATEFFSLKVEKGLTDYLEGEADIEEILINPGIDKLTLIPGGMPVDNSPELLNSARMEMMMEEIKSRYPSDRLVIVDGPAILHFPDAMILYKYVDGVLPVIESEKTSTENVKKMMEYLQEVNILGAVLNKKKE